VGGRKVPLPLAPETGNGAGLGTYGALTYVEFCCRTGAGVG